MYMYMCIYLQPFKLSVLVSSHCVIKYQKVKGLNQHRCVTSQFSQSEAQVHIHRLSSQPSTLKYLSSRGLFWRLWETSYLKLFRYLSIACGFGVEICIFFMAVIQEGEKRH